MLPASHKMLALCKPAHFAQLPQAADFAAASKRPNLIVFLLDDASPDMFSIFEETKRRSQHGYLAPPTPAMKRIAREGVAFRTAWAPALCTPSRTSLMTGKYPASTGVFHNLMVDDPAGAQSAHAHELFPNLLAQAGYVTGMTGKWGTGASPSNTRTRVCVLRTHEGACGHALGLTACHLPDSCLGL